MPPTDTGSPLAQEAALKPLFDELLAHVDQAISAKLKAAGVVDQAIDGDHLRGAITQNALLLLLDGSPDPIPTGMVRFAATPFPHRLRAWELLGEQPGSIAFEIQTWQAPLGSATATPTWVTLHGSGSGPSLAGGSYRRDVDLAGWTKDSRGWVVLPRNTRWRIAVAANDLVQTILLSLELERLSEHDLANPTG